MQNKELKKEMLENGKYSDLRKLDNYCYREYGLELSELINDKTESERIATLNELMQMVYKNTSITNLNTQELESYFQLKKSRHNKKTRIGSRLNYYKSREYKFCFATFTFNDDALKLDNKYRKEHITRLLNENTNIVDYIGNVDFGEKKGREHYHYILILSKDFEPIAKYETITSKQTRTCKCITNLGINYKKGFATYQLVGRENIDIEKTKQYIAKLTLHAIKVSTKQRLIFKRQSPYLDFQKIVKNLNLAIKDQQLEKEKKSIEKLKKLDFETGAIYM